MTPPGIAAFLLSKATELQGDRKLGIGVARATKEQLEHVVLGAHSDAFRVAAFQLTTLLDHMLTTLTGDTIYEKESGELVDSLMQAAHAPMAALADLGNGDEPATLMRFATAYRNTLIGYLNGLPLLDKLLSEGR